MNLEFQQGKHSSRKPPKLIILQMCNEINVTVLIHLGISDHRTVPNRGEHLSKKSETVLSSYLRYSETVCPTQPENSQKLPIKNSKQSQNRSNIKE